MGICVPRRRRVQPSRGAASTDLTPASRSTLRLWFWDRDGGVSDAPQALPPARRSSPCFREVEVILGQGKKVAEVVKTVGLGEVSYCCWLRARRPTSDLIGSSGRHAPAPRGTQAAQACHRLWRRVPCAEVGPVQVLFPGRRHRADAPSAVDSGQLREVPRGKTALTAVFVEAIESGLALCDEVSPIPAPGQRIPLSIHRADARPLQALTLQEP